MKELSKKTILATFIIGFLGIFLLNNINPSHISKINETTQTAQLGKYIPLEPIEGLTDVGQEAPSLQEYLQTIFKWGIAIAVILATVMIIIAGIQYMTLDIISKKEDAKNKLTAAVAGLLLALSSWLILNTINPEIFNAEENKILNAGGK